MSMTVREFWTVAHGMLFGAIYLLAFAGGFAGLWSMRGRLLTQEGVAERMRRMRLGGAPMVLGPAGRFLMGSKFNKFGLWSLTAPRRSVFLDAFYIDKYPVTNERFRAAGMVPEKSYGPEFEETNQPAVGVTWSQARDYCRKGGGRLPTEAEWEKEARGTGGWKFPWGNRWERSKLIWRGTSWGRTHPVDRTYNTHASPYGAVDMAGNISEWVADWFDEHYHKIAPARNPKGPESGHRRVLRGGSWNDLPEEGAGKSSYYLGAAWRYRGDPEVSYNTWGFRCAMNVERAG